MNEFQRGTNDNAIRESRQRNYWVEIVKEDHSPRLRKSKKIEREINRYITDLKTKSAQFKFIDLNELLYS